MASSPAADKGPEQPKNITFRFCRECSNMLYPKEDPGDNTLDFACRTCSFSEKASTSCVFRNELRNTVGETAGITQDVGQDPTVGLSDNDIPDFCTLCGNEIFCEICGQETDRGFWLEVEDDVDVSGMRTPLSQHAPSMPHELHASFQQLQQLQLSSTQQQQPPDSQKQKQEEEVSQSQSQQAHS